ncbi:MAG: class I SAM-dependent methyltransferase [Phycisphaerae bacterium]
MTPQTMMTRDRRTWDQPTRYERWYTSSIGRAYGESIASVLQPWLSAIPKAQALDVGCGPGLAAEQLFPPDARVYAVDCSEHMAYRAALRGRRRGRPHGVLAGSVDALPIVSIRFDVVLCANCLEFVPDRAAALGQIARVLRPGGQALIAVLNRHSSWELTRRLRRPFARCAYYAGRFFTVAEVRRCVESAGLAVEELRTAVHFPPVSIPPLTALYGRWDRMALRRHARGGAVILCRARKRSP